MHDISHWGVKVLSNDTFKLFLEIALRSLVLAQPRICSPLFAQVIPFASCVVLGIVFVAGVCCEVIS